MVKQRFASQNEAQTMVKQRFASQNEARTMVKQRFASQNIRIPSWNDAGTITTQEGIWQGIPAGTTQGLSPLRKAVWQGRIKGYRAGTTQGLSPLRKACGKAGLL